MMDEFKHIKQERTEEDSEVQLIDLPLLSNAGGKRSAWLARLLLGWQGSLRQRYWRQIGAVATLLLTVLAALVVLSPLRRNSAPSLVQPSPSRNPFLATYRSHPLLIYRGHSGAVGGVSWSPDGTRIASGGKDGTVQVWDATTGKHILTYPGHLQSVLPATDSPRSVNSIAWSPDG